MIIYYDQRGCGISEYRDGKGYSVDQAVDDLERLRETLKIKQWSVLGHSYVGKKEASGFCMIFLCWSLTQLNFRYYK
jgi:pimeloyl-ACP methyl ester carboxylesterase